MPLPNNAVVTSSAITGEVHLDGRPSTIRLDLLRLSSDQIERDRYIKTRMFPNDKFAIFTVSDPQPVPDGSPIAQTVNGKVAGTLEIKGKSVPLTFDVEARDDGGVIYLLGHTRFKWQDVGVEPPNSAAIMQVNDEVGVDVLLAARAK